MNNIFAHYQEIRLKMRMETKSTSTDNHSIMYYPKSIFEGNISHTDFNFLLYNDTLSV